MIGDLPFIHGDILDPDTDPLLKAPPHPELGILILSWMEIEARIAILYPLMNLSPGRTYPDTWARLCGATD